MQTGDVISQEENMLSNRMIQLSLTVLTTLSLTACLETTGTTESSSGGSNNSDFSVVTDPGDTTTQPNPGDNTSPADNSGTPPDDGSVNSSEVGFIINQGVAMTSNANLHLDFYPPFFPQKIKVSYGTACTDGTWIDNTDSEDFLSSLVNQKVDLSVQYRDADNRISACYTQSVTIDQAGPDILFNTYPQGTVEAGQDVKIVFTVSDALSGVSSVICNFQGVNKPCAAGTSTVTIPSIAEGSYTFLITAKDNMGFSSSKSVSWQVTSLYKTIDQKVAVTDNKSVDILIVIDNSGSMEYEQKSMASRTSKFLDVLQGLDYQIAITTTDPRNITLGDGRFVPIKGGTSGQYVIDSNMDKTKAQTLLSNTLQRPETGSGDEQAIYATTRVVERAMSDSGSIYGKFFRPGAQFAVLVISDEDESENGTKNDPTNLLNLLKTSFNGNKSFSWHSIITRPGDKACLNTNGYSYGYRYAAFSDLTGGVIGDVCATDYSAQVQGVAEGVRNTLKTITLTCTPIVDSSHTVTVMKDGVPYTAASSLTGLNLVYNDVLPVGNYEVVYSCLK